MSFSDDEFSPPPRVISLPDVIPPPSFHICLPDIIPPHPSIMSLHGTFSPLSSTGILTDAFSTHATDMATRNHQRVVIRQVWASNFEFEFSLIRSVAVEYPFASIDTEFPGTIYKPDVPKEELSRLTPSENYLWMKKNIDALKLIQLGLTLADEKGNLPTLDTDFGFAWEFNFCDFDVERDEYDPGSIDLLKGQGIDFDKNKEEGIRCSEFAVHFARLIDYLDPWNFKWVCFHGAYDFGFLLKILTRTELPVDLDLFFSSMLVYFGNEVYDIKQMIRFQNGLFGGLEKVADTLGVVRVVGKSHEAGSDSFLTMKVFTKMMEKYYRDEKFKAILEKYHNYKIFGLVDRNVLTPGLPQFSRHYAAMSSVDNIAPEEAVC